MIGYYIYLAGAVVTQILAPIAIKREGRPWSDALWWLILWPLGLLWPFCIAGLICKILDGPYRPRHRRRYYW